MRAATRWRRRRQFRRLPGWHGRRGRRSGRRARMAGNRRRGVSRRRFDVIAGDRRSAAVAGAREAHQPPQAAERGRRRRRAGRGHAEGPRLRAPRLPASRRRAQPRNRRAGARCRRCRRRDGQRAGDGRRGRAAGVRSDPAACAEWLTRGRRRRGRVVVGGARVAQQARGDRGPRSPSQHRERRGGGGDQGDDQQSSTSVEHVLYLCDCNCRGPAKALELNSGRKNEARKKRQARGGRRFLKS